MLLMRTLAPAEFTYALRMVGEARNPGTPEALRSRLADELAALTGCVTLPALLTWRHAGLSDRQILDEALAAPWSAA